MASTAKISHSGNRAEGTWREVSIRRKIDSQSKMVFSFHVTMMHKGAYFIVDPDYDLLAVATAALANADPVFGPPESSPRHGPWPQ